MLGLVPLRSQVSQLPRFLATKSAPSRTTGRSESWYARLKDRGVKACGIKDCGVKDRGVWDRRGQDAGDKDRGARAARAGDRESAAGCTLARSIQRAKNSID